MKASPRAPGLLRMALEMRFPMELGIGLTSLPFLMTAPAGDGHCVIVIPGLAASGGTEESVARVEALARLMGRRFRFTGH